MGGHATALDLLSAVVLGLIDEIAARIGATDPCLTDGAVYEKCRSEDLRLLHARRLWRWYADRLDQRAGSGDDAELQTLEAADEVIWSCWKTAITALGEPPSAAPIPYLSAQFSAYTTPRTDPPEGLRPGMDDLLRKHVDQLPVATVALSPVCCRRPWWLIVIAHEVSHHVQFESPGLEQMTQEQVVGAAYAVTGDAELAEAWRPWSRELFADACSVLLVGPAAIWAVGELETRTPAGMTRSPSGSYPPPLLRLAMLHAAANLAGLPPWEAGQAEEQAPPRDDRLRRLLACVPDVAAALLALKSASGQPLHSVGRQAVAAYATGGSVSGWESELLGVHDPVPRQTLDAARFCAAAGVHAWQRSGTREGAADWLSGRLRAVLPLCREPGARGGGGAPPDAGALTRRFAADLYETDGGKF